MSKSQSASEYLITYGLSLMIITIVGISLWSLGIVSPCTFHLKGHYDTPHLKITDFIVISSDSPVLADKFYIYFEGKNIDKITIKNVTLLHKQEPCGNADMEKIALPTVSLGEKIAFVGNVSEECRGSLRYCYSFEVVVKYESVYELQREETGMIWGNFEARESSYSYATWERTNFGVSPLTMENNQFIGSYAGVCRAQIPGPGLSWVLAEESVTWNRPGCCSSHSPPNNPHQVGFANAYCIRRPECLAHGWMRTSLTMDPLFIGHKLYLSGRGTAPSGAPDPPGTPGYICIDDNFYFYVNGNLIYYGGTTGYVNTEVWTGCGGCPGTGWCIPPVELTASPSFKYGSPNEIYVLLEDYCTSGVTSRFNFYIE